jgi:carbon-monoxide dehydrogenase medium subunit
MKPAPFGYARCDSVDDALTLLAGSGGAAKPCGGTQSLGPMLNLRLTQPEQLVDVSRIAALQGLSRVGHRLVMGAAVTHAQIEDDRSGLAGSASRGLLPSVAAGIAYRAVRQRGTLGGSLAHADPAADWVNTACLLDAGLLLRGPTGERHVAAGDFFAGAFTTALSDDELLVAVDWPLLGAGARWAYRKSCRKPGEFADALVALWIDPPAGVARAVLGALSAAPHVVSGAAAVQALRTRAAQTAVFDHLGLDDAYQRQLLSALLRRAFADVDADTGMATA